MVPELTQSLNVCCPKYFQVRPFILHHQATIGITIHYRIPAELGTDRIANAIAASKLYPNENLIIIDFGTATTFCVLSSTKVFLGGAIIPGVRTALESLFAKTSKLPLVDVMVPELSVGQSSVENIQSGLFYGCVGAVRELTARLAREAFPNDPRPFIIATGGCSHLFAETEIYDIEIPNLTLMGLEQAYQLNKKT